ncbi:MAG: FAD-dependent monooxygenase, partial [Woeseiaceae bacterium]
NAADILPAYDSWRFDWLDVPGIISRAGGMFEFPMVDRDPLPQWNFGRMTLLGDAAHPMYPIGSNGSTQAIRDASAIVDALVESGDVLAALARYQACRLPATAAIVKSNRQLGPELVMQIAESRAPEGFNDIENVIPRAELEEVAGRYKKLAGFSVDTLNANLSILNEAGA